MSKQMKGLSQFILDLRNTRDQNEERKRITLELNNINAKFNDNLSGYQRKKYVWKLVYMYLQGYADSSPLFSSDLTLKLIHLNVFSEKQAGYLALLVLSNRKELSPVAHLEDLFDIINSALIRDLNLNNDNFNALALQFIALNFNIGQEFIHDGSSTAHRWLEVIDLVYSFASSPMTATPLKRNAAIALNVLLKLYPQVIKANTNWVPRILSLIEDSEDLGVLTSSIPLVEFVSETNPTYIKLTMAATAQRLARLLGVADMATGRSSTNSNSNHQKPCPDEYLYYTVPAPWLIVKLLHLVEHLFLLQDDQVPAQPLLSFRSLDQDTVNNLRAVILKLIQNALQGNIGGLQARNSLSSIIFQAVSLIVFLSPLVETLQNASSALVKLLDSKETNTRYLALDALIKLISRSDVKLNVDELTSKTLPLLKELDVLIKRKLVDLLFIISNPSNYMAIVKGLLLYFPRAEIVIKSDIAVKIAILCENFAEDLTWYISTMLNLLSLGKGDKSVIGDAVWERIVQIIVNNEDLQAKLCSIIIPLCNDSPSEDLVKVAAFILGEYGHLVSSEPESSPEKQFLIIYNAYFSVSLTSRAMLLLTMLKFIAKYPDEDFVPDIVDLFEVETQLIDVEIQTRGYEYLKLLTNRHLLLKLVKQFPAYENKQSPLMSRIGPKSSQPALPRRNTFVKELQMHRNQISRTGSRAGSTNDSRLRSSSNVNSLRSNNRSMSPEKEAYTEKIVLSPNWYNGYHRMCHYDAGIFYEDQFVKLLYRVVKNGSLILYKFNVINNAAKTAGTTLTAFKVLQLDSQASTTDPSYLASLERLPEATVREKTLFEVLVKVRDVVEDNENPVLLITYKSGGSFNQLRLKFPVSMLRTLTSTNMVSLQDFQVRWKQIGDQLGDKIGESKVTIVLLHRSNSLNIVRLLSRLGFDVVHSTTDDTNLEEQNVLVMGAGILHSQKSNYGLLIIVRSTDRIGKSLEVVVRCTGGSVASVITSSLTEIFEAKI